MVQTATRQTGVDSEFQARVVAAQHGDLEAYAKAVHDMEFEPYQPAWAEALATTNRTALVVCPDSYKSTTVRLFVERQIGLNRNIRILWLMAAGGQSIKQILPVRLTIMGNPVYKAAFGIREDKVAQWTKDTLFVERDIKAADPTLMACGLNGPYQGLHFDLIIIDDPTNQEDVNSPTEMESQEQKIRGVVLDRLVEGGRIVAIFTRWGVNDLFKTFVDIGFDIYQMPIVGEYPWGPTLSPRKFPLEVVEQKRRDKGDALFQMTYMCNPEASSGNIIKRDHLAYWDKPPENPLQFFVGIDPAASTRTRADYSAIATVGIDLRTKKLYLTDMWAGRLEVPDLKAEIVKRCKQVAALRGVGLETAGFQISILQDLRRIHQLPFKEIPYRSNKKNQRRVVAIDRDKTGRAMYLDSLFTSGRLYLPRNLPMVDGVSLETELCTIGAGKGHDDRMDALAFACVLADSARSTLRTYKIAGGI